MNNSYLRALGKLTLAKSDIEKLWEDGQTEGKSFEDKQAYYILESIIEELDTAAYKLKRYSLPAIEGKLQEDKDREKFELIRNDTGRGLGWFFSCGDYLEVWDDEEKEWYPGRVEHTTREGTKGYYFHNSDLGHPFLYTGMKARVRKE